MGDRPAVTATSEGWPVCDSGQVQVMLLGTHHMANPGNDEVNVEADDVLAPNRQAELRNLTDRLTEWEPDLVAVERPYDDADEVNARYAEYRSGERAYDREAEFDSPHDRRDGSHTECRSEIVQVGFRLADSLGHDRVEPIDGYPEKPDADPFADRDVDSTRKTEVPVPDLEEMQCESDRKLASSTIPEYLAWVNEKQQLEKNHRLMFDRALRSADERFGSPAALSYWYDRNIRMVHHLWRGMKATDDRLLFVVGSGHVRALRHLFEEAPMLCPVSPLSYLP